MRLLLACIIIFYLQSCSQNGTKSESLIYLDSFNKYSKIGDISFYKADRIKNDSFKYDSLKLDAFSCFVYADSFLKLSLTAQYKETRKKYQNTDSIDTMLLDITNQSFNAAKKEKMDKEQMAFFLRKIKASF